MSKLVASLSLDLDNKWSYLRTHGVAGWEEYPSYLDVAVPRILDVCAERNLRITCFVVGRDAEQQSNRDALQSIAEAGHEIGNHSLNHYPWMHTLPQEQVEAEIVEAESLIERATGQRPIGFRGPGYSFSEHVLNILAERGYQYDATTLPTYIGPLARWYFRRTATQEAADRAERRELFGAFREGRRSIRPYLWQTRSGPLVEIPVTTFPLLRLPIHMTYLLYLWQFSPRLTKLYLQTALTACRRFGIGPSILLHPLDFLGQEDDPELRFFPGMRLARAEKRELLDDLLTRLTAQFQLLPMCEHAAQVQRQLGVTPMKNATGTPAPLRERQMLGTFDDVEHVF